MVKQHSSLNALLLLLDSVDLSTEGSDEFMEVFSEKVAKLFNGLNGDELIKLKDWLGTGDDINRRLNNYLAIWRWLSFSDIGCQLGDVVTEEENEIEDPTFTWLFEKIEKCYELFDSLNLDVEVVVYGQIIRGVTSGATKIDYSMFVIYEDSAAAVYEKGFYTSDLVANALNAGMVNIQDEYDVALFFVNEIPVYDQDETDNLVSKEDSASANPIEKNVVILSEFRRKLGNKLKR